MGARHASAMPMTPSPFAAAAAADDSPAAAPAFVVAEIGISHNGDLAIAQKLIDMAKAAGCDAVKFQKRTIDIVYTPEQLAQPRESPWGTTQGEQKAGLEFGRAQYDAIDAHC